MWVWHTYGADEKLRVSQRSIEDPQTRTRTVFTDYRYDALGRRVAVRTRWDPYCQRAQPECLSTIERTIWDGDQILMELRGPAATEVEYSAGNFTGAVRYTHGAGIDEPLAIWKDDIGGLIPHRSWRGTYEEGTPIDQNSRNVTWPAQTQDVFYAPDVRVDPIQQSDWIGSIVEGKTDASGLQFMRNRYYDPKTGRFTQEDPIGLAGGMNLYGFGGGDPVNHSDPFGLCPPDKPLCQWIQAITMAAGADLGAMFGGGAGLLTGPGAIVASPAGAMAGAAAGAGAGFVAGKALTNVLFSKSAGSNSGEASSEDRADGLRRQLEAHKEKLAKYRADPDAFDNKGLLKNATPELRAKIINGRIRNLEGQIKNFEDQIKSMTGGNP